MIYVWSIPGWLSTFCLAICAAPLAAEAYKRGRAENVNNKFFGLWLLGEIFGCIYTTHLLDYPLMLNYYFNTLLLLVVLKYKLFPRLKEYK